MVRVVFAVFAVAVAGCVAAPRAPAAESSHLSEAEIDALPNAFPATLVQPRDPTYLPMYALWSGNNPAGVGRLLSVYLRLEHLTIPISVEECGTANAFYRVRGKTIHVCYELLGYANELAKRPRGHVDAMTNSMAMFTTLHEAGHALIDILDLPIDGNEEDWADALALLTMTNHRDSALARSLIDAPARFFARHDDVDDGEPDVHRGSGVRAFDALCVLYGRHRDARLGQLLGGRAQACIEYTDALVARWNAWLRPYTRIESGNVF